jgi:hypothetical protein
MKTRWFLDTLPEEDADYPKDFVFVKNSDGSFGIEEREKPPRIRRGYRW